MKPLHINQKLTIISISSFMAHTMKREITVCRVLDPMRCGYQNENLRVGTAKDRGKRKEFYLDIKQDVLVFDGWDLPIKIDSEIPRAGGITGFSGNACYNLSAPVEVLKEYIEHRNLNDEFRGHGSILVIQPGAEVQDDGVPLYPEIETGHAVVERIKEKLACA